MQKVDVIIPVCKPDDKFLLLMKRMEKQSISVNRFIIIDSDEESYHGFLDGKRSFEESGRYIVKHIPNETFDHGRTRRMAMDLSDAEFAICMTQDAVPENDTLIEELLRPFTDETVAVSYARQLPNKDCREMEKFTRSFNYPETSRIKSEADLEELGIKTYFCSNVCACYRKQVYEELGGFVKRTIFNEDMIYAGNAVKAGYKIAYCAEAKVIHSHNYSALQQFHRNFDLGVSQAEHMEIFGDIKSESEGKKMVLLSIRHLWKTHHYLQIVQLFYHSAMKLFGYKLGKKYEKLTTKQCIRYSMNKKYFACNENSYENV